MAQWFLEEKIYPMRFSHSKALEMHFEWFAIEKGVELLISQHFLQDIFSNRIAPSSHSSADFKHMDFSELAIGKSGDAMAHFKHWLLVL